MNNIGKKIIIVGVLFLGISLFLTLNNNYVEVNASSKVNEVLNQVKEIEENLDKEMSYININGYDYIGTIIIPKINMELPVMKEYEQSSLSIAPNRYYGSIYTDDLIICGHNYKSHFGYLKNLEKSDKVYFKDFSGNVYIYEVIESQILGAYDIKKMIDNKYDLTLYTCTSDGLRRLTIRCNRIS